MRKLLLLLLGFLAMYVVATVVGFATYLLISPRAMVVAVFTLMPVVCVLLIAGYLVLIGASAASAARETGVLVVVWMVLSILFDAMTYVLIVPAVGGGEPNWGFFAQQSPWIWYAYLVLVLCGVGGWWLYRATLPRLSAGEEASSGAFGQE